MFLRIKGAGLLMITAICCLSCTFGPSASADPGPGPYTLVYKFTTGQVRTYNVILDLNTNTGGPPAEAKTHMEMTSTQKVASIRPSDGAAVEQVTSTTTTATIDGNPLTVPQQAADQPMTVVMSPAGQMLAVVPKPGDIARPGYTSPSSFGTMAFLPVNPVDVGDTWVTIIPMQTLGVSLNCKSTLKSVSSGTGANIALIETHFTSFSSQPSSTTMPQLGYGQQMGGGPPTAMAASAPTLSGDTLTSFDMDAGQVNTTTGNMALDMTGPSTGTTGHIRMNMQSQLSLVP